MSLADDLLEDAQAVEAMRDRYNYKGNAKYPRQWPGEEWKTLDARAQRLRKASAIVRLALANPAPCFCDLWIAQQTETTVG